MNTLEKDRAFVQMPGEWPRWPVLPLKQRDPSKFQEADFCGLLFADLKPKVYLVNMFALYEATKEDREALIQPPDAPPAAKAITWSDVLSKYKALEYPDMDTLLRTWMVD